MGFNSGIKELKNEMTATCRTDRQTYGAQKDWYIKTDKSAIPERRRGH
jgi:hypothetical protein